MASKKQIDSERNIKTGKFFKKQKSEIITMSENEKYEQYDEHQPLRNPEFQKLLTQTQIEILSKILKEFSFKKCYLIDKVEKLITSLLEKQYQSSQEIESKLEQIIIQIQQQIQVTPFSFQQNQSDSMEIKNEISSQNKKSSLIQNSQQIQIKQGLQKKQFKRRIKCYVCNKQHQ